MTLRLPFEFEQDPVTPEKVVSVATPLASAIGAHTFYLSRRFEFTDGDYTFTVHADDAATVWLGTDQLNTRIVASATLAVPSVDTVHIAQGSYRIDVILQNVPVNPTPCYFTMVIMRGAEVIYTSSIEGWLLDDVMVSDDDLPPPDDYRFYLPVFSVLPNWEGGVTERLSWQTDILESETDAEQRRSVRRNARRSFEAGFLRQRAQRDRLDTFFVGIGPAQFMLPIWHEQVTLNEGLDLGAAGVFFPDGNFTKREFNTGDLVFVNAGDPDVFDILQVGDTEENRFSWAFPPPRAWPKGTRIYPMRTASMSQRPKMSNITDTVSRAQASFDLVDPYKITPSWGASFGGDPLFRFVIDRAQPMEVEYGRRNYVLDNQSGVPVVTDHGRYTATVLQTRLRLMGVGEAHGFREFLQAARGRAVHFQCPTFMRDVELLPMSEASMTIGVKQQGFQDYMLTPQPIRSRLSFQFRNGSQTLYRTITAVEPLYKTEANGDLSIPIQQIGELLSLDTLLPLITVDELKRISFLCETRFDQDHFELHHSTNNQRVVDVAIVLRQSTNQRTGIAS